MVRTFLISVPPREMMLGWHFTSSSTLNVIVSVFTYLVSFSSAKKHYSGLKIEPGSAPGEKAHCKRKYETQLFQRVTLEQLSCLQ